MLLEQISQVKLG